MSRIVRVSINNGKPVMLFNLDDQVKNFSFIEVKDTDKLPDKSVMFSLRDEAGNQFTVEQEKISN